MKQKITEKDCIFCDNTKREYLIKYENKERQKLVYSLELKARDKKDAIKKASKKVGLNNIKAIYLKLH